LQAKIPVSRKEAQMSYNPKMNSGDDKRWFDWINEIDYDKKHKDKKKQKRPHSIGDNKDFDLSPNPTTDSGEQTMQNTFGPSTDKALEGPHL